MAKKRGAALPTGTTVPSKDAKRRCVVYVEVPSAPPPPTWHQAIYRKQPASWVMSAYHAVVPGVVEELLSDSDAAFKKKSYWVAAEAEPRCAFERFALEVLRRHAGEVGELPQGSGAEWWVQQRCPGTPEGVSLGFHWDRDEELAVRVDNPRIVCPAYSTVTYLTGTGAPTVVVPLEPLDPGTTRRYPKIFVSHPEVGKHIVFRGDALHGCPPELCRKGGGGGKRVTLLVNVWLGHRPAEVREAPAELVKGFATRCGGLTSWSGRVDELPTIATGSNLPVVGFQFGKLETEDHELWLPVPPKKSSSRHGSFIMAVPGGGACKVVRKGVKRGRAAPVVLR